MGTVVEKIEYIAELLTTPPKAIDAIVDRDVLCVQNDVILKDVIRVIATSEYSNIPVFKDGGLIGVANGQRILDAIGRQIEKNNSVENYINQTTIEQVIMEPLPYKTFEVVSKDATIEEVLNLFNKSRKLLSVLITKGGTINETPIGIITTADVIYLNDILDNY